MRPHLLFKTISFLFSLMACSLLFGQASIKEEMVELKTYPFSTPDPNPILGDNPKIYPYHKFIGYSHESTMKEWKVVTLENDYIQVFVLPEVGGKVWGAIDKRNGEEFIYRNEVMKFRNISMRGPWTSGGIEFNFGIIGHHPSTATPVDYVTQKHDDGSVSCTVGNIDLSSRTQWRVTISLENDKPYFETNVNWYNPTSLHQSYYNWMTAAAFAQDDLKFYTPGNYYLKHSGEAKTWPYDSEGRELSRYDENKFGPSKSYHVVGEYNDFFGGYYENDKYGFGHWAEYEEIPGQKLWLWALSRSGGIWEDLLTDTDGQYIEFQAGRELLQYSPGSHANPMSQSTFAPQSQDMWREIWFPVKDIGGISDASPLGALHVQVDGDNLLLGVNSFVNKKAIVRMSSNGEVIHENEVNFRIDESYQVRLPKKETYQITIDDLDLEYGNEGLSKIINRPFDSDLSFDSKNSASYDYYQAEEAYEFRSFDLADSLYRKVLAVDPYHMDARAGLAELLLRNDLIDQAIAQTDTVLRIDSRHPKANYISGVCFDEKNNPINALERFSWAARSISYRSASYALMSRIQLKEGDVAQATHFANKSLEFNTNNMLALQVLAVASRTNGNTELANEYQDRMLNADPISHFAHFEKFLSGGTSADKSKLKSVFRSELPEQSVLELAFLYSSLGGDAEVMSLLDVLEINHPMASLIKASLDVEHSAKYLQEAEQQAIDFVFPYRKETSKLLDMATEMSDHWKWKYYKAINLWGLNRKDEASVLLNSLGQSPNEATFYATRAMLQEESTAKESDLKSAIKFNPSIVNMHRLNQFLFESKKYDEAYLKAKSFNKTIPNDYMLEVDLAKVALQLDKYDEVIEILDKVNILPFEGASEGKQIHKLANVGAALSSIDSDTKGAIAKLNTALEWPEHLGVGKPYDPDERLVDYLLSFAHNKLGNAEKANHYSDKFSNAIDENDEAVYKALQVKLSQLSNKKEETKTYSSNNTNSELVKILAGDYSHMDRSSTMNKLLIKALSLR